MVGWDGKAQFVRYRRELAFDDPRGEPGDFKLTVGKPQRVRIVVKEFPERIGYRCIAPGTSTTAGIPYSRAIMEVWDN